eukprot:CAMPEP_0115850952 /NCGR_PEP_ID=MMETSP0287-20121206/12228_1 /TAXON_ID=412157 /ORGANISM="Chrysochromulina rotalis, Strain UIO044" /LENGTH=83 /DNA_ID=CAMNT_0003304963 /DNA_START=97 /DNA_END=348 /DNA_ORIENTATION=+
MAVKDATFAHLRQNPANLKAQEIANYRKQMGGGWSIKIMTLGLFAGTAYFAYVLNTRKRMPWQHNEKVREKLRRVGIETKEGA